MIRAHNYPASESMPATADKPECPRCGYDQTGVVESWAKPSPAACPLVGDCTECGLRFAWRDVLNRDYSTVPNYIEHAPSITRYRKAFAPTLLRMLVIWPFWRQIRLHHEVRLGRLVLFLLFTVFAGRLVLTTVLAALEFNDQQFLAGRQFGWSDWNVQAVLNRIPQAALLEPWRAVSAYSYAGNSYWGQFHRSLTDPITLSALPLWLIVSWPLTLVVLPKTLSAAKVRTVHIARAALLAAAPLGLASMFSVGLQPIDLYALFRDSISPGLPTQSFWYRPTTAPYLLALYGFWICLWWLAALRTGWQIAGAGTAWLLLLLIQLLMWPFVAALIFSQLYPYWW